MDVNTHRANLHALGICCAPNQAHIGWELEAHLDITIGRLQTTRAQAQKRMDIACM
jgi:hypothetical protein